MLRTHIAARAGGVAWHHTTSLRVMVSYLFHLLVRAVRVDHHLVGLREEARLSCVNVAVRERVVVEEVRVGNQGNGLAGAQPAQSDRSATAVAHTRWRTVAYESRGVHAAAYKQWHTQWHIFL